MVGNLQHKFCKVWGRYVISIFINFFSSSRFLITLSLLHSKDRDEDEEEDFNIKPDDNLLVAGHVDEDLSSLEISGDNCYCKNFACVSSNFYLFFLLYILK